MRPDRHEVLAGEAAPFGALAPPGDGSTQAMNMTITVALGGGPCPPPPVAP